MTYLQSPKKLSWKSVLITMVVALWGTAHAELPPPGVARTYSIPHTQSSNLSIPFTPSEPDIKVALDGQLDAYGILIYEWDVLAQRWGSTFYNPLFTNPWSSRSLIVDLELLPHSHFVVRPFLRDADARPMQITIGGTLDLAETTLKVHPGLNVMGALGLSPTAMSSWPTSTNGVAGTSTSDADTIYESLDFDHYMFLSSIPVSPEWVNAPAMPTAGVELKPELAYMYMSQNLKAYDLTLPAAPAGDLTRFPAVTAVAYDADQEEVLVEVTTVAAVSVDLFYRDLSFPAGTHGDSSWQFWGARTLAANTVTSIPDGGTAERPHPQEAEARLYQVGDATLDTDGDTLSDARETLLHETDPKNADTDTDGLADGEELKHRLDPLNSDSDSDGMLDGDEIAQGYNPHQPDHPDVEFRVFTPLR